MSAVCKPLADDACWKWLMLAWCLLVLVLAWSLVLHWVGAAAWISCLGKELHEHFMKAWCAVCTPRYALRRAAATPGSGHSEQGCQGGGRLGARFQPRDMQAGELSACPCWNACWKELISRLMLAGACNEWMVWVLAWCKSCITAWALVQRKHAHQECSTTV